MSFTTPTKNLALDAIPINLIKVHSGDPGAAGTANTIAGASAACVYAAAANAERDLDEPVAVPIALVEPDLDPIQVSHFSVWEGTTFRGGKAFTSNPETYSNNGVVNIVSAKITLADVT